MTDGKEILGGLRLETPGLFAKRGRLRWQTVLEVLIGLIFFALALTFIRHELRAHSFKTILADIESISFLSVFLAVGATAASSRPP